MQAVIDHDAERAVILIADHVNRTASLLEMYAAHTPDAEFESRVAESRR